MGFRCGQNKYHIFRGLFQCFQQRIECSYRKHMDLIYNIDFVPSFCRPVRHLLADLADIVHAVVGRGINLYHIHRRARGDRSAHGAFPAWASIYRMLAVYRFRKYLCHSRLSSSPCPAEQIRMSDPFCFYLVFQCLYYGVLTFYVFKFVRTELPVQCRI